MILLNNFRCVSSQPKTSCIKTNRFKRTLFISTKQNMHVCPKNRRSLELFVCLDLVSSRTLAVIFVSDLFPQEIELHHLFNARNLRNIVVNVAQEGKFLFETRQSKKLV